MMRDPSEVPRVNIQYSLIEIRKGKQAVKVCATITANLCGRAQPQFNNYTSFSNTESSKAGWGSWFDTLYTAL